MKIRELYLRSFGKFLEKKVVFHDGINVIYGENESGKSTVHTFIKSMLFGLERGRGRASSHDTYSIYEPWENPNYYAGKLRFESGGKQFCLTRTFDKYSKSASLICEDDGEEFSIAHGDLEMILDGLKAQDYDNTVAVAQMRIETNQSLASALQNYASDYYTTGSRGIHLDDAMNLLNQKKKAIEKEIRELLHEQQNKKAEIEREKSYIWREIQKLEEELEQVEDQIEKQQEEQVEVETREEKKWRVHPLEYVVVLAAMVILCLVFEDPLNYLSCIVLFLAEGIRIWNRLKDGKRKSQEEVLREVENSLQKLLWKEESIQEELKERKILYSNLQEKQDELEDVGAEYQKKEKKRKALELAMERLTELSAEIHRELSYQLNQKASEILKEITGGKYDMLLVDEKLKMSLYTGERKVPLEQLSRGTVEQIYFALRMAAGEILYEEEYPVILDDTFVFYDDVRLENTLRWLKRTKKQVIIFTCQKREEEILKKLGLE